MPSSGAGQSTLNERNSFAAGQQLGWAAIDEDPAPSIASVALLITDDRNGREFSQC